MSKIETLKGFVRTFFWLTGAEWKEMDRKLVRIGVGIVTFAVSALFWLYFFRSSTPFG
jgi:hypothetical protein